MFDIRTYKQLLYVFVIQNHYIRNKGFSNHYSYNQDMHTTICMCDHELMPTQVET